MDVSSICAVVLIAYICIFCILVGRRLVRRRLVPGLGLCSFSARQPFNPTANDEGSVEVDAVGLRATPIPVQTDSSQKSFIITTNAKRTAMLDHLQVQAVKQAAAMRQRASPYGHG